MMDKDNNNYYLILCILYHMLVFWCFTSCPLIWRNLHCQRMAAKYRPLLSLGAVGDLNMYSNTGPGFLWSHPNVHSILLVLYVLQGVLRTCYSPDPYRTAWNCFHSPLLTEKEGNIIIIIINKMHLN